MPTTARMVWRYPVEDQKDWWDIWVALMNQQDVDVYAASEDPALKLRGGGIITLDTGTDELSWSEDLELVSTLAGVVITIAAGTLAGFTEGQIAYIDVSRPVNSNRTATMQKTSSLGVDSSKTFIALRKDDVIYMRNGVGGEPALSQRVEHTTANVTALGGVLVGEIDVGVKNGVALAWIKAVGNTTDTDLEIFLDSGLTELAFSKGGQDFFSDAYKHNYWFQNYDLATLTDRKIHYRLTNNGLNDSTYVFKINPVGAK